MEDEIQLIQSKCSQLSQELERYQASKGNVADLKKKLAGFLETLEQLDAHELNKAH